MGYCACVHQSNVHCSPHNRWVLEVTVPKWYGRGRRYVLLDEGDMPAY